MKMPAKISRKKGAQQSGFSIVEIMIALPVATIVTVVLIAALFTQYTSSLAESSRSNLRSSGQTLLLNLQDELLFTIAYGEQIDPNLADPLGVTWAYNTSPQTLIVNEIALDSTRRDDDRHIVRRRLNTCETSSVTANPVAINSVVYFVGDNPGSDYDTLYKRTITPTYDLCSIDTVTDGPCTPTSVTCRDNAKQTTCTAGNIGMGDCEADDSALTDRVVDLQIRYFTQDNVETAIPSSAEKIEVTLTLGDKVYGKNVEAEVKHTIRKIN